MTYGWTITLYSGLEPSFKKMAGSPSPPPKKNQLPPTPCSYPQAYQMALAKPIGPKDMPQEFAFMYSF